MRTLQQAAKQGNHQALLTIKTYCYRFRKYIGAYTAAMQGLDVVVFTGGIGEHSPLVRSLSVAGLNCVGIEIEEISMTEQYKLGVHPPVKMSGNLDGTPGLTIAGREGRVTIDQGLSAPCAISMPISKAPWSSDFETTWWSVCGLKTIEN